MPKRIHLRRMQRDILLEIANNMILLLDGTDTVDDFRTCYTAGNAQPIDLDVRFPDEN